MYVYKYSDSEVFYMFNVGDIVLYSSDGVCKITEITKKEFGEISATYYVLKPVFTNRSTFFVPAENEKLTAKMHAVLTKEELQGVIKKSTSLVWQSDDALRKDEFKAILSSGDFAKIVSLFKAILAHKNEIEALGKKLHRADETAFKDAQKIIYEEFALCSDLTKDDVFNLLIS